MSVLHPRHHHRRVQSIDFAEDRSTLFQLCPLMRTGRAFRYFRPIREFWMPQRVREANTQA
jgi:hypothetical protein